MTNCTGDNCPCNSADAMQDIYSRQLREIGIDESWLCNGDAVAILAFHKFLNSGEWQTTEGGERMFVVDQRAYDFGTGKISSKEYLDD